MGPKGRENGFKIFGVEMGWPLYLLHLLIISLIRIYKLIELQVWKYFIPLIRLKATEVTSNMGVVFRSEEDEGTALTKGNFAEQSSVSSNYKKTLRFRVHKNVWFARVANQGLHALGETYADKMWDYQRDVEDLTELISRVVENDLQDLYYRQGNKTLEWVKFQVFDSLLLRHSSFPQGKPEDRWENSVLEIMLDAGMQYSCGLWTDAKNLKDAQLAKMEMLGKKLKLQPGMKVLDIGCGHGTLCQYLAEHYQVACVGLTARETEVEYGRHACRGLPVDIRLQDWKTFQPDTPFDRVVSISLLETLGGAQYRPFLEMVHHCLKNDGYFLLQTVGRNHRNIPRSTLWMNQLLLPNPSAITGAAKDLFVLEEWQNYREDYLKTVHAWRENFIRGWPQICQNNEQDKLYRRWIFYLSFTKGLCKAKKCQLWQLLLTKSSYKRGQPLTY